MGHKTKRNNKTPSGSGFFIGVGKKKTLYKLKGSISHSSCSLEMVFQATKFLFFLFTLFRCIPPGEASQLLELRNGIFERYSVLS